MPQSWRAHAVALFAYATVAIVFSWPLPLHLGTSLTGEPGGDTGVYVWNQWVFHHELIEKGSVPYFTDTLFGGVGETNLSLHNYTTFADLIAIPLRTFLTVVQAFNVVYLALMILGGYAVFLLAHQVTHDALASWLAGLVFGWSPILITRGTGHFSLLGTAPLAIFLLLLVRANGHVRVRDAIALGATIAWASMTDVYYAVFCLVIGLAFVVGRVVSIERRPAVALRSSSRVLNVAMIGTAAAIAFIAVSGGVEVTVGGHSIRSRTLYTPVLILTILAAVQIGRRFRFQFVDVTGADVRRFVRLTAITGVVTAVLASPLLYAAGVRLVRGDFDTPRVFWRSSPPGIDLLALVLPNPNHPLAPDAVAQWLTSRPQAYIENVASLPYVALAILFFAWRAGWRPSRWWVGLSLTFGLLALGPFIHVAGVNTYVPGPWALLRYVPIIGLVHTPARFAILFTLCVAILVAQGLGELSRRHPRHRRVLLGVAGLALVAELIPAPLTLYSAEIPPLYRHVAAAPRSTVLLEIPTGVADGVSNLGAFTARTEFNQTAHGRTVMGGFLSRIARRRVDEVLMNPVHRALATLSEKRALTAHEEAALVRHGPAFIRDKRIGFVVVDRTRTSPVFEALVTQAFGLRHVETNGSFVLYSIP
ncbi:MAG TPA: hypothetical protein VM819_09870 [Vicinamibacterales bacterium]|nr:hypothetical protein [Vicinamibacterales bacterium]